MRAALESVGYRTRDVVEAMVANAGVAPDRVRVDGGAVGNDLLCQFTADALGIEVVRPVQRETTAFGAAAAAGLAVGYWDDLGALGEIRRDDRVFVPELDDGEADRRYGRWREAVERSRDWARDG